MKYSQILLGVIFFSAFSAQAIELQRPSPARIERQGSNVTLRSDLTIKHYFRTYVRDGNDIYMIRLKGDNWIKRHITDPATREYVLSQFKVVDADMDRLTINVHGRTYTENKEDGEEDAERPSRGVDRVEQDETVSGNVDHEGSIPFCQLVGTCSTSGSSSSGNGSSSGSTSGGSSSGGGSGGYAGHPTPVISGNTFTLRNQTLGSPLSSRLTNYDSVLIENNTFRGGRCTAITVNPCTVKNVIIRNNSFENWNQTGCDLEMVIYIGWQASHTNCRSNILIEGNRFTNTSSFKRAIETKTSNVVIRGNTADSRLEVRHGRNVLIENNAFSGYEIFGEDHILRNNSGGRINLGDGQITQAQVAPRSGYPAARNILLQGNKSPFQTFCWGHSAVNGCPVKATFKVQ